MDATSSLVLRDGSHVALLIKLTFIRLLENDLLVRITHHG